VTRVRLTLPFPSVCAWLLCNNFGLFSFHACARRRGLPVLGSGVACGALLGRCDGAIAGRCPLATSREYDDQNDDDGDHDNSDPDVQKLVQAHSNLPLARVADFAQKPDGMVLMC